MKISFTIKVSLLAFLACFLWSTAFVAVKTGLEHSKPLSFAGIRFMLAGLLLLPFWWKISSPFRSLLSNLRTVLLIAFFQTFVLYGLLFLGMTRIPGALAAIIIGSSPMISAIVAHFLISDDKMSLSKVLCILIGIMGVFVISISRQPWSSPTGFSEFIGILLLLLGSLSSAFGNVIVAKDQGMDPLPLNSAQMFLGGLFLFLLSFPVEGVPTLAYPLEFYMALLWLVFISAAAFTLWFVLLKWPGVKFSELNLWKFVIPVSGAILSWMLIPEEHPNAVQVMGMVCVAASILSFNMVGSRQRHKAKAEMTKQQDMPAAPCCKPDEVATCSQNL